MVFCSPAARIFKHFYLAQHDECSIRHFSDQVCGVGCWVMGPAPYGMVTSCHLVTLVFPVASQEQTLGGLLAHSEGMLREEAYKARWRVVTHHPANMELSCAYNHSWLQKTYSFPHV